MLTRLILTRRQAFAEAAAEVASKGHLKALCARAALLKALARMSMEDDTDVTDASLLTWLPTLMRDGVSTAAVALDPSAPFSFYSPSFSFSSCLSSPPA